MYLFSVMNFVYNEIEYLTYYNLWIVGMLCYLLSAFSFGFSVMVLVSSVCGVDGMVELLSVLVLLVVLWMVLVVGFVIVSNVSFYYVFVVYSCGVSVLGMQ